MAGWLVAEEVRILVLIKIQKRDSRTTLSNPLVPWCAACSALLIFVAPLVPVAPRCSSWICTNASATALCWAEGADEANGLGSSYDVVYKKKQHGLAPLRSKHCPGLALAMSEYEYGLKVKIRCTIMLLSVY